MPDEKRKEYVKEQESKNAASERTSSQSDEERKRRALEARKQAALAKEKASSGKMMYCIIQEMGSLGEEDSRVTIITDPEFERMAKEISEYNKLAIGVVMEKRNYKNALQALNNFSKSGWELVNSSAYAEKGMVIHEYLVGMAIK